MPRHAPPIRCALPETDWPSTDRQMFGRALTPTGLFEDGGAGAHLRPPTVCRLKGVYGRWLRYLTMTEPDQMKLDPHRRLSPERVRSWLATMEDLSSLSIWSAASGFASIAGMLWPDMDWTWLRTLANRLRRAAEPKQSTDAKARYSVELFQAGLRAMEVAESEPEYRSLTGSSRFRDGLMVSLLAARPIRRRGFAGLLLTRHVKRVSGNFQITLFPQDVKCGPGEWFLLPESLVPSFARYLDVHRPRLLRGNTTDALWVTREGKAMTLNGVSERFKKATPRIVGERLSMHAFRHSAASTFFETRSEDALLVPRLLGHNGPATIEQHYLKRHMPASQQRYYEMLEKRRRQLEQEIGS